MTLSLLGAEMTVVAWAVLLALLAIIALLLGMLASIRRYRLSEERAQRAVQSFEALIDNAPQAVYWYDADGTVRGWNAAAKRIFQWDQAEVIGEFLPIVRAESRAEFIVLRDRVLKGNSVHCGEVVRHRKDGSEVAIRFSSAPLRNGAGKVTGVISISEDMTNEQAARRRLVDQALWNETLLEAIPAPIYYKGLDGRYLGVNRAFEAFFNVSRREWIGHTVSEKLSAELAQLHEHQDELLLQSGTTQHYPAYFDFPDRPRVEVDYHKSVIRSAQGQTIGILGVLIDNTEIRNAEADLKHTRDTLNLALEGSRVSVWDCDLTSWKVTLTKEWRAMLGYPPEEISIPATYLVAQTHPDDLARVKTQLVDLLKGKQQDVRCEHRVRGANGSWVWVLTAGQVVARDEQGRALRAVGTNVDLTARKQMEEEIRASEEKFRLITESASDLIALVDDKGRRVYSSPSYKTLFGGHVPEAGSSSFDQVHPDDQAAIIKVFQQTVATGQGQRAQFRFLCPDGTIRHVESSGNVIRNSEGHVSGIVVVSRDITERLEVERQMHQLALHDVLTGLPNRAAFIIRLDEVLALAAGQRSNVALMFVDLDNFKSINDTLGHATGDRFLCEVAKRLRQSLRAGDFLARVGGDEFTVIVEGVQSQESLVHIIERTLEGVLGTVQVDGHELNISGSIGVSLFPEHGCDRETLIRTADTAMYSAKTDGKGRYRVFNSDMETALIEFTVTERKLRAAIRSKRMHVLYQPFIELKTSRLIGFEALARWIDDDGNLVSPSRFIPIAEDSGLIVELGTWVLEQACRTLAELREACDLDVRVSVNVSGRQLRDEDFTRVVDGVLRSTGLPPSALDLEITETVMMQHVLERVSVLEQLRAMGVTISVDDFGTGYSSLGNLKRLPIDRLKIDRSFIADMEQNPNDAAIMKAIINIGKTLGLAVVAEGVEREAQLAQLCALGCDEAQGYLIGRPMPASELADLCRSHDPSAYAALAAPQHAAATA